MTRSQSRDGLCVLSTPSSLYSVAMTDKKVDVRALAALSRMEVSDAELETLEKEIPSILAFVETIQAASAESSGEPKQGSELRNVMREDGERHESGIYTEKLLAQAPAAKDGRIVVKQVIS